MRQKKITLALSSLDANGVCADQTTGAAADLLLNGALVVTDVKANFGVAAAIRITCAADESARTFVVYGEGSNGSPIQESMTGPAATTGDTTQTFKSVTRVSIDGAASGEVEVGQVANDDGACEAQTPANARNLAIDGAAAKVANMYGVGDLGVAQIVAIANAGDDSGDTFTVYGRDANDVEISEAITGGNDATVTGSLLFKTVNRVAVDGATHASGFTVGTVDKLDGIAISQVMSGAGDVVFNGELCELTARHITIEGTGDNSGITLTIEGTDRRGNALSEAVTGSNAGTATSAKNFRTITSIRASGAVTDNVEIGSADSMDGPPIPLERFDSGITFAIEHSSDGDLTHNFVSTLDRLIDGERNEDTARWFETDGPQVASERGSSVGAVAAVRAEITNFVAGSVDMIILPPISDY
ncbi:MAG: hypothetical protein KOO63_05570 [Bacteroidales bacterium]|nr:hypothetical protein [Candidatus Latescibacterota bacterium]